jgi:predicted N-acetyltransferase YhbS
MTTSTNTQPVSIRPLEERDLENADRIFRLAFGTFLGFSTPESFAGDSDFIRTRWRADPTAALVAESNGAVVGSNMLTRWGSVGFFGPLTVHPSMWDRGIAKELLTPTMNIFDRWQVTHAGLFTFPHSAKHVGLYQKFGFWPRFLTMVMSKPVSERNIVAGQAIRFSQLGNSEKPDMLHECRDLTDSIYPGLDVERETRAVDDQHLGDTILAFDGSALVAFAVCHSGAGSEAGSGACYVKFGAVRPMSGAEQHFSSLLRACEQFAIERKATRLLAGVNTSRSQAYRSMLLQGFRTEIQGVVMERGKDTGYNHEGVYLIDDWR